MQIATRRWLGSLAAALAAASLVGLTGLAARLTPEASADRAGRSSSPNRGELARCRELGAAASGDVACRFAWRESRRLFLGD